MKGYSLRFLAERIGAELINPGVRASSITGLAALDQAGPEDIGFFTNPSYRDQLRATQAGGVILAPKHAEMSPSPVLVMDNPYLGYARASELFAPPEIPYRGIHPSAWIAPDANLGRDVVVGPHTVIEAASLEDGVAIGAGCVVERNCVIGAGSVIHANATLRHGSVIGPGSRIHSGAVIGADGFGHAKHEGEWVKIAQLGRVILGREVEIGANTTIDRGALGDTVLADGVKLDNLIQIAHNVRIGAHTAIAGCVGIAGSATIGGHCSIGGGVGIVGHIEIVDHVHITGGSIVLQSIREPGIYSSGVPLQPNRPWHRNYQRFKQLDELAKRVHSLEAALSFDRKPTL